MWHQIVSKENLVDFTTGKWKGKPPRNTGEGDNMIFLIVYENRETRTEKYFTSPQPLSY